MAVFHFGIRPAISPSLFLLLVLFLSIIKLGCAAPVAAANSTLNLSGIECTRNPDWVGRWWKPDMLSFCVAALQRLEYDEVVGRVNRLHEFLPVGVAPIHDLPVVRTPHKTTWGLFLDSRLFSYLGLGKLRCDRSLHGRGDDAQVTDTEGLGAYKGNWPRPVSGLGSS